MKQKNINIRNKRANFDYELLDSYTAGIALAGTEIKSIRQGKASLVDSFCIFSDKGELWVNNMNVSPYFYASFANHELRRPRKLLLHKNELRKLERSVKETGNTIVPTRLFINDRGLAKLNISVARGKKQYDKRQSIKEQDDKRQMDRAMRR